jgi:fructokinase
VTAPYPADAVLIVGEALVDVIDGQQRPGGSPMNVAVGLARLGIPTVLHTSLGQDDAGQLVARHLRASGVTLTAGSWGAGSTSVAEVRLDPLGVATYRFDIAWDPQPVDAAGTFRAVHVGSISAMMPPGAAAVDAVLSDRRSSAMLSYDINVRSALMDGPALARARAEAIIAGIDVVKASDEDIAWLYPGLSADGVVERWLGLGSKLAVLTLGARGARTGNARTGVEVVAPPAPVRDTVGAGDSFMAGLLAGLDELGLLNAAGRASLPSLGEAELRVITGMGVRCAAVTVTREGADPPRRTDLA